jgi:hypothetical protein
LIRLFEDVGQNTSNKLIYQNDSWSLGFKLSDLVYFKVLIKFFSRDPIFNLFLKTQKISPVYAVESLEKDTSASIRSTSSIKAFKEFQFNYIINK